MTLFTEVRKTTGLHQRCGEHIWGEEPYDHQSIYMANNPIGHLFPQKQLSYSQ